MTIDIDEDLAAPALAALLRKAGHDVRLPVDRGLVGALDPVHFRRAIEDGRVLLTRNWSDFVLLHELVFASGGNHPGLLVVRADNDPTRDLTPRGIVGAIGRLAMSGLPVLGHLHILNHWR